MGIVMLRSIAAFFRLSRPLNVLITMISVYIGGWIGGIIPSHERLLAGMILAGLTCAGANAYNDYMDSDIDRINKPGRPIPSGAVKPGWAWGMWVFMTAVSLVWSFSLGHEIYMFIFMTTGILWYYNRSGKRKPVLGNALVSVASALAFIFGGFLCGTTREAYIPAIFALLFHFGREIVKDMEDVSGDHRQGSASIPLRYGTRGALILISITFLTLIIFTFYPYLFHNYRWSYMLTVLFGVDLLLVYFLYSLWDNPDVANAGYISRMLKADMIIGLFALILR